jgi:peptidyl-prolyl cis-trans isomerase C
MKMKILLLAAFCGAVLLTACNQSSDHASPNAESDSEKSSTIPELNQSTSGELDDETLLTINGEAVTRTMYSLYFQDRMRGVPEAKTNPDLQMSVLNELSNIIIVSQDAEKQGLQNRPEVAASIQLLKAKLLTQIAIQDFATNYQPSEEDIQKVYQEEYAERSGNEYKARHILVKEEEEATGLIEKLDGGADFAELAKEHSTGPTGKDGGDLGWFDAAQMVKPFGDALKSMEKGKYSSAPVKTQFGWHVILLEDTRETEAPSLDSVKEKIVNKLKQTGLSEYMKGLRDSSKLVFNEKNAKPAPGTEAPAATDQNDEAPAEAPSATDQTGEAPAEAPAAAEQSAVAPVEEAPTTENKSDAGEASTDKEKPAEETEENKE